MTTMILNAKVQPAKRLKRIVTAIAGVERYGRMTIQEDCLFLEAMNPNHRLPVSLILNSAWFDSYNLLAASNSRAKENPNFSSCTSCTIILDLCIFDYLLGQANDDDQVEIYAVSDSKFNRFYLFFDHRELGLRCLEMMFWRTIKVEMSRLRDMESAYGDGGFKVAMSPHHFTHVLRRSMVSHSPLNVDITSSMIMLSSGAAIRFLEQGSQCAIENFPEGGFVSLQLYLHMADYVIRAASIAKSIAFNLGNQVPPSMFISIEKFATLHFFLAFDSTVQSQIMHWSDQKTSSS